VTCETPGLDAAALARQYPAAARHAQSADGDLMLTPDEMTWLLGAVVNRDAAAFERLYEATRARLYGVVLRIVRRPDLAAEVMQDTYTRIWRNAAEFDPRIATPMTWMVAIARGRALDLVRSQGAVGDAAGMPDAIAEESGPANRQITEELRRLLACLGELEPEHRRLVLLAYYSGWSREQLATRFETALDNVRVWLREGLLRIRECLSR
jgi:RNA polymerase sigma-70 factor, ECF subfamily